MEKRTEFTDMRQCIIVDTDGTLANCEHRRHHLDSNRWDLFFEDMHLDTVIEHTKIVVDALRSAGYAIVIVTARPDDADYKQKTINWYVENEIEYDAIYMRTGGDYRADYIVKEEILAQVRLDGFDPIMALDDRDSVVALWRRLGIPCMQVNDGDFDHTKKSKYAGQTLLTIMIGLSGVGKSTYIEKNFKSSEVVSSDAIREEIWGDRNAPICFLPENMNRTFQYAHDLIKARLNNGLKTVYDATNLRDKDRKEVLKLLPEGVFAEYVVLNRNYDDVLKSKGNRKEEIINKHYNTFRHNLKNILKGDSHPYVHVRDKREFK